MKYEIFNVKLQRPATPRLYVRSRRRAQGSLRPTRLPSPCLSASLGTEIVLTGELNGHVLTFVTPGYATGHARLGA